MTQSFDLAILGGGVVGLWTAAQAARRGASVAVIEVGPRALSDQVPSNPAIEFVSRENLGAVRARNQVLGGNSSYWGGGLVRNAPEALADLYGPETAQRVEARYESVETALGVGSAFEKQPLELEGARLHEVAVLPGKKRGLWASFRDAENIRLFLSARITGVKRGVDGSIEELTFLDEANTTQVLRAREYALSMGVVDSNLFVQDWLSESVPSSLRASVGTRLHDHWSVPIASLSWKNGAPLGVLFPPKFKGGVVAGRRLTKDHGFFHIVADLDTMPPYDRVKDFLRVRQQRKGTFAVMGAALRTCASPWKMLRAGTHYLAQRQLFIPDGSTVRLVLDFESSRSEQNRIFRKGQGAALDWDLRPDDYDAFEQIVRSDHSYWDSVMSSSHIAGEWMFEDSSSPESMRAHLREAAVDAYHLGGGLHPDYQGTSGPAERNGRLRGCSNVFVNGTAFFCRPGPGNPVLTLLARADVYVEDLTMGARS